MMELPLNNCGHIYHELSANGIKAVDTGLGRYRLSLAADIKDSEGNKLDGITHFDTNEIILDVGLEDHLARETLIHEILHCIARIVGLDPDTDTFTTTNEFVVNQTAKGLMLFKYLNPDLFRLLFSNGIS